MEALRLRVKDLVLQRSEIIIRDAKGGKDRVTVLPTSILNPLGMHLAKLRLRFDQQRKAGEPGVSLPTHLVRAGYDIRTIQELMGHADIRATMLYTHVLGKGALGVKSPLDRPIADI